MNINLFKEDARDVEKAYNTLRLIETEGNCYISGAITIVDGDGNVWHTYRIEIHPCDEYPYMFPKVIETDGAIPPIADWHINIDGTCCLDNEFSQQIKCFGGLSLIKFVEKELLPWLANQSYRRVTGNYINGEQGHGDIGRIDFFMLELRAPNLLYCVKWMIKLVKNDLPPRQAECFCGSGVKWRNCHRPIFEKLSPISKDALQWAITKFSAFIKGGPPVLSDLQKHTKVKLF